MCRMWINVHGIPRKMYPRRWRDIPKDRVHPVAVFDAPDLSGNTVFVIAEREGEDYILLALDPDDEELHILFLEVNLSDIGYVTYEGIDRFLYPNR